MQSRSSIGVLAMMAGLCSVAGFGAAAPVIPEIFAPGVISGPANDGSPTFSPDGETVYFTRSGATWSVILESHQSHGTWSEPRVAPFSGQWSDSGPALSPDGKFIVFASVRPLNPQGPRGDKPPAMAAYLWRANRVGDGWGPAFRLPDTVNFSPRSFRPTVAANGSIYFNATVKDEKFRLYRAGCVNGIYTKAEALPFSDGTTGDVDPEIAPDESFLVFSSSGRRPGDATREHLFLVVRRDGGNADAGLSWGAVTPMRYQGDEDNGGSNDNEARSSPDHRTLYFSSDRTIPVHFPRTPEQAKADLARLNQWDNSNANVWSIPLFSWIDSHATHATP